MSNITTYVEFILNVCDAQKDQLLFKKIIIILLQNEYLYSTYFSFSSTLFFVLFILNLADNTYMLSLKIWNAGCSLVVGCFTV